MDTTDQYALALSPSDPDWPTTIETTDIPGLLISRRPIFADERGFFREVVELRDLERALGKVITVTQWNHSRSVPGVVRGFHAEPWEKLVSLVRGRAMAVYVDLRTDSPAFGKTVKLMLREDEPLAVYVPTGVANSFANVGTGDLDYLYLITGYYEGKPTPAVSWRDPLLTRQFGGWPIEHPIVSDKDQSYPTLEEVYADRVDFGRYPWLRG